ncbi:hypothetical protein BDW60DRAFT_186207 [Aspergillus nidulans var. acristatus]
MDGSAGSMMRKPQAGCPLMHDLILRVDLHGKAIGRVSTMWDEPTLPRRFFTEANRGVQTLSNWHLQVSPHEERASRLRQLKPESFPRQRVLMGCWTLNGPQLAG